MCLELMTECRQTICFNDWSWKIVPDSWYGWTKSIKSDWRLSNDARDIWMCRDSFDAGSYERPLPHSSLHSTPAASRPPILIEDKANNKQNRLTLVTPASLDNACSRLYQMPARQNSKQTTIISIRADDDSKQKRTQISNLCRDWCCCHMANTSTSRLMHKNHK